MSNYSKETDTYLTAIKHGDLTQFKPLYDLIASHLFGLINYYLIDKSYFEDALLEVYERILMYINSYVEGSDGYNWICKIAENTARKYNMKRSNDVSLPDVEGVLGTASFEIGFIDRMDLCFAIDKLQTPDREIVYNYFYLGKTMEEIGRELNLSKSAIKKRLDKSIEFLKKFVKSGKL